MLSLVKSVAFFAAIVANPLYANVVDLDAQALEFLLGTLPATGARWACRVMSFLKKAA